MCFLSQLINLVIFIYCYRYVLKSCLLKVQRFKYRNYLPLIIRKCLVVAAFKLCYLKPLPPLVGSVGVGSVLGLADDGNDRPRGPTGRGGTVGPPTKLGLRADKHCQTGYQDDLQQQTQFSSVLSTSTQLYKRKFLFWKTCFVVFHIKR